MLKLQASGGGPPNLELLALKSALDARDKELSEMRVQKQAMNSELASVTKKVIWLGKPR